MANAATASWGRRHATAPRPRADPWLVSLAPAFSAGLPGPALDLACGLGQNTLWVAGLGIPSVGVDVSLTALSRAAGEARRSRLPACFLCADVEAAGIPARSGGWGAILVFRFLCRPILTEIAAALAPGGVLAYRTHLRHGLRGPSARPRRASFLLEPGELLFAVTGLVPLAYREWAVPGQASAALLARRETT